MSEDELILTHILQCPRIDLYLHKPKLTAEQTNQFDLIKKRRVSGEPLQYILGQCEFMGISLKVDSRALIPRPETELLVEQTLKCMKETPHNSTAYLLDVGTGSGNIPIALLKHNPSWRVVALDISNDALALAHDNAAAHGVLAGIKFIQADITQWLNETHNGRQRFKIVVSNPPYISSCELGRLPLDVQKEPTIALDGGEDGLKFYKHIINNIKHILDPGGWLILEIGETQGKSLENLLTANRSFVNIQILKDLNSRDRILKAQLRT